MMSALRNTFNATRTFTLIETAVLPKKLDRNSKYPLAGFLNGYANDPTNYWYPNQKCLEDMLKFVGYTKIQRIWHKSDRITLKAIK